MVEEDEYDADDDHKESTQHGEQEGAEEYEEDEVKMLHYFAQLSLMMRGFPYGMAYIIKVFWSKYTFIKLFGGVNCFQMLWYNTLKDINTNST